MKKLLVCLFTIQLIFGANAQLIDPHSMDFIYDQPLAKEPQNDIYKSCEIQTFAQKTVDYDVYFKRIVSLLIKSAGMQMSGQQYFGQINVNIAPDDFEFLQKFSKLDDVSVDTLRKLDAILTESFRRNFKDDLYNSVDSFLERLYNSISTEVCINTIILISASIFLYLMFQRNVSLWYIFKYMLLFFWLFDCYIKYVNLQEDYEKNNMKVMVSGNECDLTGTWNHLKYILGYSKCEKKIFSPLVVIEEQFRHIVGPLHYLGEGLGKFGYQLFANLPWGLNIIMFPVMLIFILLFGCIGFSFVTGVPISFNFFHLIKLQFGQQSNSSRNVLTENTLNRVLDAVSQKSSSKRGESVVQAESLHNTTGESERVEDVVETQTKQIEGVDKKTSKVSGSGDVTSVGDQKEAPKHLVRESGDNN